MLKSKFVKQIRFASIGDCCADRYADGGVCLGGTAYNVALAAQKAGARTTLYSSIGNDATGSRFIRSLQKNDIEITHLRVRTGTTSSIQITLDATGRPSYGDWNLGVLTGYTLDSKAKSSLVSFDISRCALFTPMQSLFESFIRVPRRRELKVGDFGGTSRYCVRTPAIAAYAGSLDVIIKTVEDNDAAQLRQLRTLSTSYPCLVLALRGRYGSIAYFRGKEFLQPAAAIRTKNTTGAGDIYQAVFLIAYRRSRNIRRAMQEATRAVTLALS